TLCITFAAEMHHRFFVPVCFVDIIAVFLCLSVHGNKTFVITSCHTALITGRTSKVKHIPYMAGPDPGTLIQDFCHMFMVQCLIFFAVILACRIRSMIGNDSFTSVFGKSQTDIRMDLMEVVQPGTIILHLAA